MPNLKKPTNPTANSQRGVVLLITLMFLVVLTLLGLAMFGTTSTEEKMARNFRDSNVAFSAADAALRAAELRITGYYTNPASPVNPYLFNSSCTNGLCDTTATQPVYSNYSITAAPSVQLGDASFEPGCSSGTPSNCTPALALVSQQPRYLIELICWSAPGGSVTGSSCQTAYRITSIGFGRSSSSQVILQEVFVP